MLHKHYVYMARAIQIAKNAIGSQKTNPLVGCVIVHDAKIVAEGFHEMFGKEHAEINALKEFQKQNIDPAKCDMYITLEPCVHQGKTGPCVSRIIDFGFRHLYIGTVDPNPIVCGNGIEQLHAADISVKMIDNLPELEQLIKPFKTNILANRPYIILKWAESADSFMGKEQEQIWLSNKYSKTWVHRLRSKVDGIMVGSTTLVTDNPGLTVREIEGNNPSRIIVKFGDPIDDTLNVWSDNAPVYYFHNQINSQIDAKSNHIHTTFIKTKTYNISSFKNILQSLVANHIGTLLIEGGAKTLNFFIKNKLWDEAFVIKTDIRLNSGIPAPLLAYAPSSIMDLERDQLHHFYNETHNDIHKIKSLFL